MSIIKKSELNVSEIKDFLRHIIKNNRIIQESGKVPVTVELIGDSGLGKTSIAKQIGEEFGLDVTKLSLTQCDELGDLIGYPLRQFEMRQDKKKVQTVSAGIARTGFVTLQEPIIDWIDEVALEQFKAEGFTLTGKKRTVNCPPDWIAGKEKPVLLILDDFSRADLRFLQAVMELIDQQEYLSWKLPKGSQILLTSNPPNGNYIVNEMDIAMKTRYISVGLKWDAEIWAAWAEREGIDSRAINFILSSPEIVDKPETGVNPRSLTAFFNAISSIPDFEKQLGLIQMIGEGSIGVEATLLFTAFIGNRMDKMITPKKMLEFQDTDEVLKELRAVIAPKGENYRSDIASILASRLINYSLLQAENKKISDFSIRRLITLVTDETIFSNDISYVIAKKLVNGHTSFKPMIENRSVQTMVTK